MKARGRTLRRGGGSAHRPSTASRDAEKHRESVALGISIDTSRARLRDQLAGLPKRHRGKNSTRRRIDPSPREIAAATARIRAGWPMERFLPSDLAEARRDGVTP